MGEVFLGPPSPGRGGLPPRPFRESRAPSTRNPWRARPSFIDRLHDCRANSSSSVHHPGHRPSVERSDVGHEGRRDHFPRPRLREPAIRSRRSCSKLRKQNGVAPAPWLAVWMSLNKSRRRLPPRRPEAEREPSRPCERGGGPPTKKIIHLDVPRLGNIMLATRGTDALFDFVFGVPKAKSQSASSHTRHQGAQRARSRYMGARARFGQARPPLGVSTSLPRFRRSSSTSAHPGISPVPARERSLDKKPSPPLVRSERAGRRSEAAPPCPVRPFRLDPPFLMRGDVRA